MSGWDVSSTPTWGQHDGPEETQAFAAGGDGSRDLGQDSGGRDFDRGGPVSPAGGFPEVGSGFPGESPAGGPPPEFNDREYGQDQELGPGGFPQRTPGQSLQGLPRREPRGKHSSSALDGFSRDNAFGRSSGYGQDEGFGPDGAFGRKNTSSRESSYGQDNAFGQDNGFRRDEGFGRDGGFGQGDAFSQGDAFGQGGGFGQDEGLSRDEGFGRDGGFRRDEGFGQSDGFGRDSGFGQGGGFGQDEGLRRDEGFGRDSGFGQGDAFGQGGGFGQDEGLRRDEGFGRESGFGQSDGFGQESAYRQESALGPDNAFGQDGGFGQNRGGADQPDSWGRPAGRQPAPWEEAAQQDRGYPGQDGQQFGQQDYPRQAARPGFGAQEYGAQDYGARDYGAQEYGAQEFGVGEFPDQQGRGVQDAPPFGRGERDRGPGMRDPALSDFFAPERGGGSGGYPDQGAPERPGDPRYRPSTDDWEAAGPQAPRGGTGPRPADGPLDDDPEPRGGLGMRGLIAIGAVVAVIIVIAVVLFTNKSGGSSPTASGTTPSGGMTTPAAKSTAGAAAGGGGAATTAAYTLSTPATAGGYAIGQDPHFLATATATAKEITTALASGGGGTAKGTPVSAAYMLPASSQVITFVGFQGTFTPAKLQTVLASLGSDPHTYQAGPDGGSLGCINTTAAPSGAVCVWATSSTLGVTEFFSATGPETLNAAQSKGAADTLKLRASVEKKA